MPANIDLPILYFERCAEKTPFGCLKGCVTFNFASNAASDAQGRFYRQLDFRFFEFSATLHSIAKAKRLSPSFGGEAFYMPRNVSPVN
ncbi:hypothetical protein [Paenibacillus sp. PAMC21692]|uniref:hypothetical protein n=1 Tax=Paenibacillus sp. PAMC21692 TaxID=2762320 RepID=UPI00164CF03C|nr:hypothetical protein [Paenibacillus sp. PAMC21692]QNK54902.1 hypothetical protein H7F31_19895 [Paenibacillus sp. PAMC21692]